MPTPFTFFTYFKSGLFLLLFWVGLNATGVQAQQYTMGAQAGLFTPIDYGRYASARLGFFTGLSFDYRFPGKFSLGSHYQFGTFSYAPNQGGQTGLPESSSVQVHLIYWTLQRHVSLGGDWNLAVGTGPGFFLARHPDERDGQTGLPVFSRDFTMPLLVNLSKPLGNVGTIGVKSGLFFTPFYAIGGFHLGPEIRFRF